MPETTITYGNLSQEVRGLEEPYGAAQYSIADFSPKPNLALRFGPLHKPLEMISGMTMK
jgi:hypothetical protein